MFKKLKQRNEGFTIIEVLIVLAIAALILLIVFLAVPALQRNSRNTGRKNDAARVGTSVNDWVSNHNGTAPSEADMVSTVVPNLGNLNQYSPLPVPGGDRQPNVANGQANMGNTPGRPRFRLVTAATCNADGTTTAGNPRRNVIQYQLETPNNTVHDNLCLEI